MAIEDALVLGQELLKIGTVDAVPLALQRYNRNRVVRAAAVQGMSRLSSAILFQYNAPLEMESLVPLRLRNAGPRSVITRACQGFLQKVAFPLQFEFLFSFPGRALDPEVFGDELVGDFTASGERGGLGGPKQRGVAERTLFERGDGEERMSFREWMDRYW
jgi:hypothetical protein